jgi:anthranilate synthase/aminodeoxychorismate synthase-like glutamine amidotransferase
MRLLLVDNYDSFTYNLAHLFGSLEADVDVIRNDSADLVDGITARYDATCIGPGPGRPEDAGRTLAVIRESIARRHPLFGVCLGLQAIGYAHGAEVVYAPHLMHGKTSRITHRGENVFAGVPSPFDATRYHSLCISAASLPPELPVTATSEDGVVQGIAHRDLPIFAVQFHPESVLTPDGKTIFSNFLAVAERAKVPAR